MPRSDWLNPNSKKALMVFNILKRSFLGFLLAAVGWATVEAAELLPRDAIEVLRGDLKANRKAVIAENMQLTEQESEAFWPLYRSYRADVDKVTDHMVELVLEYADLYTNVPEQKASEMLGQYTRMEADLLEVKHKYLKKFEKVLPPSNVFRFAQLDNRYDLATRVQMATSIPLMSTSPPQAGDKH